MGDQSPVAKARIVIEDGDRRSALLSRKNAPGRRAHAKLEMLGGHLDDDETAYEAIVRELREEEGSGVLARILAKEQPPSRMAIVDGAPHHLFEVRVTAAQCEGVHHDPHESLGFEQVPIESLDAGAHDDDLTYRTRLILEAFGPTP